ncbi:hypothetical protein Hte_010260 [Hypoxylon texense]
MGNINQSVILSPTSPMITRIKDQRLNSHSTKALPTFYRNLEEALDVRRASHSFHSIVQNSWQTDNAVDFCSGNILSLGSDDERRAEFLGELARHSDFSTGSTGVRLMDGNYSYLEQAERDIAAFHGAEAGLLVGSAFEANVAVWTAIPRPGDVIVHDSLVHASSHEGIKQSMAMDKVEFAHNDVDDFRRVLLDIIGSQPLIKQAKRSILVAVESIYSMDGDVCPLEELVEIANEISGEQGNIQFIVDEAHSVGVIGPRGAGLVCELGLEDDIAIVVHSFGKAIGATGESGRIFKRQQHIQNIARLFYTLLTKHPLWEVANERKLLSVPLSDGWEERHCLTHIIAISTRQKCLWWLYFHLLDASFCVFPVEHPVVPLGRSRLRVILHASNTDEQITRFVDAIFAWVKEMLDIDDCKIAEEVTESARNVYVWMRKEGLTGYGLP